MSALALELRERRDRLGLKGPRAADWLVTQGIDVPATPNTWTQSANTWTQSEEGTAADALLAARLGAAEFFLEDGAAGTALKRIFPALDGNPPGVYPVLREDWAFGLGGEGVHDVLAQVCNVNFAALPLDSRPLIMTLMIGVAVLVVPQIMVSGGPGGAAERRYRIWCDPTFGPYLGESLGAVVIECGGRYTGVSG
jgi:sarcosine oxidase, subunit gamma